MQALKKLRRSNFCLSTVSLLLSSACASLVLVLFSHSLTVKVAVVAGKIRLCFLRLGSPFWKVEKGVKLVLKH